MYGTVARIRALPGKEKDLLEFGEQLANTSAKGQIADYIFKLDKGENEYIVVALFSDREAYHRNAQDPETDRRYRMLRELLVTDPEWNDGEVVQANHYG